MNCILCHERIDLFDLDDDGYCGLPAHRVCAGSQREALREALDDANRSVVDWHERHPRRPAAA